MTGIYKIVTALNRGIFNGLAFNRGVFNGAVLNSGVFNRAVNLIDLEHSTQYEVKTRPLEILLLIESVVFIP